MSKLDIIEFAEKFLGQPLLSYHKELILIHYEGSRYGNIVSTPLRHGKTTLSTIIKEYQNYLEEEGNSNCAFSHSFGFRSFKRYLNLK